jgi:transcriptional regulator with XRE-family HTH domain
MNYNDLREELKRELNQSRFHEFMILEIVGKLMAARYRKQISQRELSRRTGIAQKTISRIENGIDIPELSTIFKLSEALDLEISLVDKQKKMSKVHSFYIDVNLNNIIKINKRFYWGI